MRVCLTLPLHRISSTLHSALACSPLPLSANITTMAATTAAGSIQRGRLADFLDSQNEAFVADLKAGKGAGWHLVTGNEAGGRFYNRAWGER